MKSTDKLRQSTLLFLIKEDNILLARKKRGFGANKLNGVGGKPNLGENIKEAALRECWEEICVAPQALNKVARLNFYFPDHKASWNQQVVVYTSSEWIGEPMETEEMKPQWFKFKDIPYDEMWSDDKYWLPEIIKGNSVEAIFKFDDSDVVIESQIKLSKLKD